MKNGDVIVAVSFSPYAKETLGKLLVQPHKKGVKHIAITDSQISPLIASAMLLCRERSTGKRLPFTMCYDDIEVQTLAILLGLEKEKKTQNS